MMRSSRLAALVALAVALACTAAGAQPPSGSDSLRREVERRFDVLPVRDGIVLHPKSPRAGVRSIEITSDSISIDGAPATGAELRQKLGADADLVLRLSYLDADTLRALGAPASPPSGPPRAAEPRAAEETPPPPPQPSSPSTPAPPRRTRQSDDRVRVGGRVVVEADEVVNDVVVIGGTARVDGEVRKDIVVVGGMLEIGPTAEIGGDVSVVGGTLRRDPGAKIAGRVSQVGPGIDLRGLRFGHFGPWFAHSLFGGFVSLMSTLMRCAVLCILASLVLLFAREYVEGVSRRAAAEPVKAAAVGLLAELLFFPVLIVTVVFLVVIIIGIPLLVLVPFALLALAVVFLVGFTAVSYYVGQLVSARFGTPHPSPYVTTILGILVVMSPVLLGRIVGLGDGIVFPITGALLFIGFCIEYVAWTIGFGAVALNRFDRRGAQAAPSAPAA
jgi:hypothetical protein